jgi:predicted O-linked N-acetylglucosamine transferase (SPINDLY family)
MSMTQPPAGDARVQGLVQSGFAHHGKGEFTAAEALYAEALRAEPANFHAQYLAGSLALQTGRPEIAADRLRLALALDPRHAPAHNDLGCALAQLARHAEALASFEQALVLAPQQAQFHGNRANMLVALGRRAEAVACYDQAIGLDPQDARAYHRRGETLFDLGLFDAARGDYATAIALRPDFADAHNAHGNALFALARHREALASFDTAIALRGDFADAHNNRGNALHQLGRLAEALASIETAVRLHPDYPGLHFNRGQLLDELQRYPEAVASYDATIALRPEFPAVHGNRLLAKAQVCDWRARAGELANLEARVARGEAAASPFAVLALSPSAQLQQQAAATHARSSFGADPGYATPPQRAAKIRVGYFSCDFDEHPLATLTAELFETHDRDRFEVFGLSFGAPSQRPMRQRLERAFDRFFDVRDRSAKDIVALARSVSLDIAVDLAGYTKHSRPTIFALRAAPIQIGYLGFLGTMAAPFMDYLVADATLIPATSRAFFTEAIVYLPSYQPNDRRRQIADPGPTRTALGLPEDGFVFCCCNANYKIAPATFAAWMRILERVAGSVLVLVEGTPTGAQNLRDEARARGIAAERLVFVPRIALPDYLARYRCADLFLDTLPYNGGATVSDALWAGLPVLTCAGETFAGRIAASLLGAAGLPELVTETLADYEQLAVDLAQDPARLAKLRQRLARAGETSRLFDTPRHTLSLESAFQEMIRRLDAGTAATDIVIS